LQFGYDAWGNLLSSTVTQGSAPMLSQSVGTNNRIAGFCYDAAGNLLQQGACPAGPPFQYNYNGENQLVSTGGVNYLYDGDGRRVSKSNGKLYWYGMGSDTLDETDSSGNLTNEYIFFNGKRIARRDSSNNVDYYFADHLGTARVVTSAAGAILDDSDFYPFGGERAVTSSSGNAYKFTGKERDSESGNDYFGARHYASSLGRFMQPDPSPMGIAMADPQSWNLYSYVRNRPTRSVDVGGNWATYVHADILTVSLSGYVSAGELKQLIDRQYAMDKIQDPAHQFMHAMSDGKTNQTSGEATQLTADFINGKLAGAKLFLNSDGSFSSISLEMLGDAIHTLQDLTSPMHRTSSGDPVPWRGGAIEAAVHFNGEASPSADWAGFGLAVRLTMAAYMLTSPEAAAKHGLNKWNFENEAQKRISDFVNSYYDKEATWAGAHPGTVEIQRDAARQCALGNPAACD
jgi:RHS repeat-associated protein